VNLGAAHRVLVAYQPVPYLRRAAASLDLNDELVASLVAGMVGSERKDFRSEAQGPGGDELN